MKRLLIAIIVALVLSHMYDIEVLRKLHAEGKTDAEVAEIMDISYSTANRYRHMLKLQHNKPEKVKRKPYSKQEGIHHKRFMIYGNVCSLVDCEYSNGNRCEYEAVMGCRRPCRSEALCDFYSRKRV